MLTTRLRPEQLKEFEQNVQQTAMKFPAKVVRIRHSFGYNWDGDPAIFFRVVLSDDASHIDTLGEVTARIRRTLSEDLRLHESEYFTYFNFRNKTEADKLKDPEWE